MARKKGSSKKAKPGPEESLDEPVLQVESQEPPTKPEDLPTKIPPMRKESSLDDLSRDNLNKVAARIQRYADLHHIPVEQVYPWIYSNYPDCMDLVALHLLIKEGLVS